MRQINQTKHELYLLQRFQQFAMFAVDRPLVPKYTRAKLDSSYRYALKGTLQFCLRDIMLEIDSHLVSSHISGVKFIWTTLLSTAATAA